MKGNDIKKLLEDHKNLILSEARKYSSNLPVEALQIEAFKLAKEAAKDFDPKSGNKFSTYLVNSLQKLSRLSTSYGQVIRTPENQQFLLNKLNKANAEMEANSGREATLQELSDKTKISLQEINRIYQNKKNTVNMGNLTDTPVFIDGHNDEWVHFVYHDLSPIDKLIMEHRIGFGGKEILTPAQISEKFKMSNSTVNNRINLIQNKILQGWKD